MPRPDQHHATPVRVTAVHATSTSALRAVAVLLAVVLLLAAVDVVITALTGSRPAATMLTVPTIRHTVLIQHLPPQPAPGGHR
jgi:hypothetical protein